MNQTAARFIKTAGLQLIRHSGIFLVRNTALFIDSGQLIAGFSLVAESRDEANVPYPTNGNENGGCWHCCGSGSLRFWGAVYADCVFPFSGVCIIYSTPDSSVRRYEVEGL